MMRLNLRKHKFREVVPSFLRVFDDYSAHGYVQTAGSMWETAVKHHKREILLKNAKYSRDLTYAELINFLKPLKLNLKKYVLGKYECRHFATDLHNKAERAGIRAGVAYVEFECTRMMHAVNVFDTRDKGLVFIDCTGFTVRHKEDYTAEVTIIPGKAYNKKCLFLDKHCVKNTWIVKRFDITW